MTDPIYTESEISNAIGDLLRGTQTDATYGVYAVAAERLKEIPPEQINLWYRNELRRVQTFAHKAISERHAAERRADDWQSSQAQWKDHAKAMESRVVRLEAEVIDSNEFRAFVRGILIVATEALEEYPWNGEVGAVVAFQEALEQIRDMILPTQEERAHDAEAVEMLELEAPNES